METTNETVVPAHYNPSQLVTYKVIREDLTEYPTSKVTDLEWELEQGRRNLKTMHQYISNVNMLEERLADYLDMDAQEIVSHICSIFGFNPTKEIEFEATATITGIVRVPLDEFSNFDVNDIDLTVYADSHSHDVDVDIEIDNISTL
jgi:hypothetical protein